MVEVTGKTSTPIAWAIRVNLDQPPWSGSSTRLNLQGTGTLTMESTTSALITGTSRNGGKFDPKTNNPPITDQQTALVTICDQGSPIPPAPAPAPESDWYSVTTRPGTWSDTQACVVVTVATTRTNLSTYPFFYGWTTKVDLTAAKLRITGANRTLDQVMWSPNPSGNDYTVSPDSKKPPGDSYVVTSGFDFALRAKGGGSDSKTFTVCVTGK